jgi:hypothetical protein
MAINRAGHDPRRSYVERLNGISGLFQGLYRLPILSTGRSARNVIREQKMTGIRTHRRSHSLTVESYEPNAIAVSIGVTIGKNIEETLPLATTEASLLNSTTLIFAKCADILRMVFPVFTSQRKTDRSPPDETNLALSCALKEDEQRSVRHVSHSLIGAERG